MSKPTAFRFWVIDEPEYATIVDRAWLAHALRAYRHRHNRGRYLLRRAGLHRYTVVHATFVVIISL